MWKPWDWVQGWADRSHVGALANARAAATELGRRRVERAEVELFLQARSAAGRVTEAG